MSHKHWAKDHPFYERAPVCQLTKAECDRLWTFYLHGHEGRQCEKEVLPGNKTATCNLVYTAEELERRRSKRTVDTVSSEGYNDTEPSE